jgi:hypothetical protein
MDELTKNRQMRLRRLYIVASLWATWYALYRAYYALGGMGFLFGTIAEPSVFRRVNALGAAVIFILAFLPLVVLKLWNSEKWHRFALAVCWLIAVAACAHAFIDMTQRILSLSGHLHVQYDMKVWQSINYHKSDLQDLLFNEPWFLVEGLLFAMIGWKNMPSRPRRLQWIISVGLLVAVMSIIGILSATGVIGKLIIG